MKRILLADGTGTLQDLLCGMLQGQGYGVLTSATAEDAFLLHEAERVDIIIADLELPAVGGDKLCCMIRENEDLKGVYFLMVCSGKRIDLERCGKCEANSYVKRPPDPEKVSELAARVLEAPEQRATRVLVKATVQGTFKSEPFYCLSRNLSVSGILIETDKTLAKGDVIHCSFYLPDYERISAAGVVVRVGKGEGKYRYLCGMEFTQVEPEQKEIIEEFIDKQRERGNFL